MYRSNRPSTLKFSSIITFIALVLLFCFPSYIWPRITDEKVISSPITHPNLIPASQKATTVPTTKPSATAFPEKIWYKLGPRGVTEQARKWIDSCLGINPTYTPEYITDLSGDAYVQKTFAHRPDIVDAFLALPFPILKADFLRYMLLFNEGGVYFDLDVSCEGQPIRDWIPEQYRKEASLVVGWEFDVGWGDSFVREFATWTIMAKPRSPHLLMLLDDILEGLREKTEEYNVTVAELTWTMVGDVVDLTGPRRMTRSIYKSLKATLGDDFDQENIAALYEPKLIGDVLVLPGYSFALSSNHYKPEETQSPVLVTHHFDGSWKNDNGGETIEPPD